MSSPKHSSGSAASRRRRSGGSSGLVRKCSRRSSALGESAPMIIPSDSWTVPTPRSVVHIKSPVRWLLRRNSRRSGRQNSSRSPVNTGPLPTDFIGGCTTPDAADLDGKLDRVAAVDGSGTVASAGAGVGAVGRAGSGGGVGAVGRGGIVGDADRGDGA